MMRQRSPRVMLQLLPQFFQPLAKLLLLLLRMLRVL